MLLAGAAAARRKTSGGSRQRRARGDAGRSSRQRQLQELDGATEPCVLEEIEGKWWSTGDGDSRDHVEEEVPSDGRGGGHPWHRAQIVLSLKKKERERPRGEREIREEGKREEAEERDARVLLEVVAGGARSRGAGWVRCRDEEKVVACCNWVAAENKGAGCSDPGVCICDDPEEVGGGSLSGGRTMGKCGFYN